MTATRTSDPLLTTIQAAEYLGVQPQTLAVWRSQKRYGIPYIRVGAYIRYRQSALDQWLASRTVAPACAV
jgi:excisionase family DNA binding protein